MEHINEFIERAAAAHARKRQIPTVSHRLADGRILEMVHQQEKQLTAFALGKASGWELVPDYKLPNGDKLVPYSWDNNLLRHGVVLFPERPEEYGTEAELVDCIQAFIHRYADIEPLFEKVACYYVLMTWLFDQFNELPYLRVRGEPGSGKTRFLLTVGRLCYRPIFASGASSVSPLFRILDSMQGTLVIDESDFRLSDERAEVVKILNNGNMQGFPVLRTETVPGTREFNPRAYHVFGPKIVATRGSFDDAALESRFLTEHLRSRKLRPDIPINLPRSHAEEAGRLRNQLLQFRFRHFETSRDLDGCVDRSLEPRLSQIFAPLLSIIEDRETRADLQALARQYQQETVAERGLGDDALILEIIRDAWLERARPLPIKELLSVFQRRHGSEYPGLSAKRLGWLVRRRLGLATRRSSGLYVVGPENRDRLRDLCARYGIAEVGNAPDVAAGGVEGSP